MYEISGSLDRAVPGRRTVRDLTVRRLEHGVRVEIVDNGRGFRVDRVARVRHGLRDSIRGRMAAIGGRADVVSTVGSGTRVRLEWSHA